MRSTRTEFRPSKLTDEDMSIARRLAERFEALRKTEGMTKAQFAAEYKVPGGASMVTQNTKGNRPISLDQAKAYARGFGCSLAEISPKLAAGMPDSPSVDMSKGFLSERYSSADESTRRLIEIALLEDGDKALQQLSPSIVAMVRMVKTAIAAEQK